MQDKSNKSGIVAGILLPMGLTCLFAFCSLALALMGGQAYKEIQGGIDDSFDSTVAASYLRNKLSQNNVADTVSLRHEGGYQVLVIETQREEQTYETRIFIADGILKESFISADIPFNVSTGMTIAKLQDCQFSLADDGLFEAVLTSPTGVSTRVVFALAQGGGT